MPRRHVSLLTASMLVAPLLAMPGPAFAAESARLPAAHVSAKQDFCRIVGSSATVRAKPRRNAAALGTAYKGDTCTAHGWAEGEGSWVEVMMKRTGITGYVHSSLVVWGEEELADTGR
ncbi:SH3 domain-containing protein [Streptomyces sp. NPDC059629]|uniref:SH3 domain-containing protein n=1 Tax=Streptomyces sp. NPDC059629 TaxID=3346889 RepID=UPI00368529B7